MTTALIGWLISAIDADSCPSSLSDSRDKRSNFETNGIDERIFSNEIPFAGNLDSFVSPFG
jgi:hypothetical protein